MNEQDLIEVTLHVNSQGVTQPRTFVWQKKVFRVTELGSRWTDEDGDHILVMVAPHNNVYQLLRAKDGRWYLDSDHDRPTITLA